MKYFEMFAGVGGFSIGLDLDGFECVGMAEVEPSCCQVIRYRFPGLRNFGDVRTLNAGEIPDFDLLTAGFPCQSWSVASRSRLGLEDMRGQLIYDVIRILRERKPSHFLLENVIGLLTMNNGVPFMSIITELSESGYAVDFDILNAKDFGVPQSRERVFIIGKRIDLLKEDLIYEEHGQFDEEYFDTPSRNQDFFVPLPDIKWRRYCEIKGYFRGGGGRALLPDGEAAGGSGVVQEAAREGGDDVACGSDGQADGDDARIVQLNRAKHSTNRLYSPDGLCPTVRTSSGGNRQPFISIGGRIRKMTVVEYERVMGWPDNWTLYGRDDKDNVVEHSNSKRYNMCGNGVVSNVVRAIARRIV